MLSLADSLLLFWNPCAIILVQVLWLLVFLYAGRSTVTGATLQFHLHRHRI
jgi:hypothetical protein